MLGSLFYPKGTKKQPIPFDSLFIPYIYKEIYFDGVYIDVLNQRKNLTIVDIGANIGVTVQHFRDYAKTVYAIEPSPEHFEALKKNKEFNKWNNVKLFNYAIADKDGVMSFGLNAKNRTMSRLMSEDDKMGDMKYKVDSNGEKLVLTAEGFDDYVKVPTKTIDHFFDENKIEQVDFMKFDVEGAEDMILRSDGFKKVCERIKAIEIEFHYPTWPLLASFMESLGYQGRRFRTEAIIILFTR